VAKLGLCNKWKRCENQQQVQEAASREQSPCCMVAFEALLEQEAVKLSEPGTTVEREVEC
jgi:hypothetical protein